MRDLSIIDRDVPSKQALTRITRPTHQGLKYHPRCETEMVHPRAKISLEVTIGVSNKFGDRRDYVISCQQYSGIQDSIFLLYHI